MGKSRAPHRPAAARLILAAAALLCCAGLAALGLWQLQRRAWKLDLIERVDLRVHAAPVAPPAPAQWPLVSAAHDEYRRVRVCGSFLGESQVPVRAATALGSGYWILTPLRGADGTLVLVNRGFVPALGPGPAAAGPAPPGGSVQVTGLLRLSEPGGSFLRRNDLVAARWVSRDVAAIAAAGGLRDVAPFFIDAQSPPRAVPACAPDPAGMRESAQAEPASDTEPVPGLTVIAFPNNHLVSAITWFALSLMAALAAMRLLWSEGSAGERKAGARS